MPYATTIHIGNFLEKTSPLLLKDSLIDIVENNARPIKPIPTTTMWQLDVQEQNESSLDESSIPSSITKDVDRIYESETWYAIPVEKVRKVAKLLLEHEQYNKSKDFVSKDNFQIVNQLSNVIGSKVLALQSNASLKVKAADTLLSHTYMNKVDKDTRHYYENYQFHNKIAKKKERDIFIASLSVGLEKSLISPT